MDHFPEVYAEYYKDSVKNPDVKFSSGLMKKLGNEVQEEAKDAVKIVGVWDTVAAHAEGWLGEKIEFHNTELSSKVQYAYHALSLDEGRIGFEPTLWQWPKNHVANPNGPGLKVMRQVWFSGSHSDIGGGLSDSRLSDITLAWMIAQCSSHTKLAFIDEEPRRNHPFEFYLLPDKSPNLSRPWATAQGETSKENPSTRQPLKMERTRERIHRSIQNRDLKRWPCGPLKNDIPHKGLSWRLKVGGADEASFLEESDPDPEADRIEEKYRGRIRPAPSQRGGS